jgi:hypothetical protein
VVLSVHCTLGGLADFRFALSNGAANLEIDDFWVAALRTWGFACFTVDGNGTLSAYMNGELKGSIASAPVPYVRRAQNFIGESNWYRLRGVRASWDPGCHEPTVRRGGAGLPTRARMVQWTTCACGAGC